MRVQETHRRNAKISIEVDLGLRDVLSDRECCILNEVINRVSPEDLQAIGFNYNVTEARVRLILAKIQSKMEVE